VRLDFDLIDGETKILRQPHGLRVAGLENLGDVGHGNLP